MTTDVERPTAEELARARGGRLRDVWPTGLLVVFCGVNPGLYSAAVGHHFARPGNRFWKALQLGGFTDRVLGPEQDRALPSYDCGLTNLVDRATAKAAELDAAELRAGVPPLRAKARRRPPRAVAILGVTAYRAAFGERATQLGRQPGALVDGVQLWVLPNPSGLNAHHQVPDLAARFAELRRAVA